MRGATVQSEALLALELDPSSTRRTEEAAALKAPQTFEAFSARIGQANIFRRLVLGWIESYDCNQILIFSGFSRSTKLSG